LELGCSVFSMKRDEVLWLVKEIVLTCEDLYVNAIMLMLSSVEVVHSQGYQLHIKTEGDEQTLVSISSIAKNHGLTVYSKPEENLIVIYQPLLGKH